MSDGATYYIYCVSIAEEDSSDEDSLNTHLYTGKDYAVHCITFVWKLVFAVIPPECIAVIRSSESFFPIS